jgi:hypothetical protein
LDPDGGRFRRPVRLFRSRFHEPRFHVARYLVFSPSLRIGSGLLRCAFSTAHYGSFGLRQLHVPRFRVVRYLAFPPSVSGRFRAVVVVFSAARSTLSVRFHERHFRAVRYLAFAPLLAERYWAGSVPRRRVHRRVHPFRSGQSSGLDPDGGRFRRPVRLFRSRFHESRFRVTRYLVFSPSLRNGFGLSWCAFSTTRYGSFGLRRLHELRFRVVRYLAFTPSFAGRFRVVVVVFSTARSTRSVRFRELHFRAVRYLAFTPLLAERFWAGSVPRRRVHLALVLPSS